MPNAERNMQPDMRLYPPTHDRREGRTSRGNVLIFKGQGFVKQGMGRDMYDHSEMVRELHDVTNDALGFSLTDTIFNDPNGDLLETWNAQPATILTNYAQQKLAEKAGNADLTGPIAYTAGNSLGEYSAAIARGSITYVDAIRLVAKRGQYMHEAHLANPGRLATPLLARDDEGKRQEQLGIVDEVRRQTDVVVCLLNSRTQVVLGGTMAEMDETAARLKDKRIKFTPLKTIGAFHHPVLMKEAAERLAPEIDKADIRDADGPIIANTTAAKIQKGSEIRQEFKDQMTNPVLWLPTTEYLFKEGFNVKVEMGEKSTFLDMLQDHPVMIGAGITTTAIVAGGITVGWRLVHPHHKE